MSENKFIKHLRGEQTAKSVLELKNQRATTSFANMPEGTSNANEVYSDHRGNATAVLKGTDNWKLNGSSLVVPTDIYGDGRDVTGTYDVAGQTLWVNASYTFPAPKLFTPNTKWVLKLCGNRLLSSTHNAIPLTLLIKFGATTVVTKNFTVKESAFNFAEELVVDFAESNSNNIKASANSTMTVQVLCGDATASATIYNGMTVFTALQRKVDSENVSSNTATFDDLETKIGDIEEQISGLGDDFVKIDGTSIMTAPLKFAAGSMRGAVGPYLNGVSFWKMNAQHAITNIANLTDSQFLPVTTNSIDIGRSANKWKDLYLSGTAYISTINNGRDINVPDYGGTMVVAEWGKTVQEGMFLRLDRDLHPIWETVTLTTSLSSLTDVTITSATNGQVLTYDGSKWVNQAVPTPTVNYSIDGGNYTAGSGTYAITRYSLILQKADFTWEKPTDTSVTYTEATTKTANTNGFILNQIRYYGYTSTLSSGALTAENKVYSKYDGVRMSYSTNCGTAPAWALGTWIYLVGTLGADGLFYLDTTQWWADALPNSNDGKLYIRLGTVTTSNTSQIAFLEDRPIFYHDGNDVKEYYPGGSGSGGTLTTSIDADIVGTPTISGADVSGFSSSNYLKYPALLDFDNRPFEIVVAFTTGNSLNTTQNIFYPDSVGRVGLSIQALTNGNNQLFLTVTSVLGGIQYTEITSDTPLNVNTKYYAKLEYDGTKYILSQSTDGASYTQVGIANNPYLPGFSSGGYMLGYGNNLPANILHLDGWYIKRDGILVWQGMGAPGLHQRVAKGHEIIDFQAPTSTNNYTWYRKYADGWVEQGGYTTATTNPRTITFPIEMAGTNYHFLAQVKNASSNGYTYTLQPRTFNTTSVECRGCYAGQNDSGDASEQFFWEVKGMYE